MRISDFGFRISDWENQHRLRADVSLVRNPKSNGSAAFRSRPIIPVAFVIFFVFAISSSPAAGQDENKTLSATLAVAAEQNPKDYPFRNAVLTVRNDSEAEGGAVRLRWIRGGPTMIFPAAILPRRETKIPVFLPAVHLTQAYHIELLSSAHVLSAFPKSIDEERTGGAVARTTAEIVWPVERLTRGAFLDPIAYDPYQDALPQWSGRGRRRIFLGAVCFALALSGILFIRKMAVRGIAGALVAFSATMGGWLLLQRFPPVLVQGEPGQFVLTARRTGEIRFEQPEEASLGLAGLFDANAYPVYFSRGQMERDDLVFHAVRGISLTLHPEEVRIFRSRGLSAP
jgi:hypothetical protein